MQVPRSWILEWAPTGTVWTSVAFSGIFAQMRYTLFLRSRCAYALGGRPNGWHERDAAYNDGRNMV